MTRLLGPALRAASVPPFHAMAMGKLASEREAAGQPVLHLEVGQPGTPLPARAAEAVAAALRSGHSMGYTNAPGLESLRERIAHHYAERYGVRVAAADVLVVGGASAGFTLAFLSAFDVGSRVGVLEPGYPCYRNTLLAIGAQPVAIPVDHHTRWGPTAALLDAAGPLDGLVIASPSNPTGTVLSSESLAEVTQWCAANGAQLIADEIYHGITYNGPAPTVLSHTANAVVVNSFSKYFSMTGWRLGWMVVPAHLGDAVERLQQNLYICAPHVSQVAGLAAFDAADELDSHVQRYAHHRELLIDGLSAAGFTNTAAADGAFYVYADIGHLGVESPALCRRWLDELGLAASPGIDFDLARGTQFVRFSYAGRADDLARACELLQRWRP
jgi:aspartate/methionine/tyrosine aminotransferase